MCPLKNRIQTNKDYELWQWRGLSKQRIVMFPVLQALVGMTWINIRVKCRSDQLGEGEIEYIEMFSLILYSTHAVLFVVVMWSALLKIGAFPMFCFPESSSVLLENFLSRLVFVKDTMKNLVNDSQGQRICAFSALSLGCALCVDAYMIMYDSNRNAGTGDLEVFTCISIFAMSIFQNMGLPNTFTIAIHAVVLVVWITYMISMELKSLHIVILAVAYFYFALRPCLQEMECFQSWKYLNDTNTGGVMGRFNEDVATYLVSMEHCIYQQYMLLKNNAMLYKDRGGVDKRKPDQWSDLAGCVQENAQLCRALNFAAVGRRIYENNSDVTNEFFSFHSLCSDVFEVFEARCGTALTLYLDDSSTFLFIQAKKDQFESMIFSLLYDCVHSHGKSNCKGVCNIRLENRGDEWRLCLEITKLNAPFSSVDKSILPDIDPNRSIIGSMKIKKKPTKNGVSERDRLKWSEQFNKKQMYATANWMLFDKNVMAKTTSMDRVANCIANKNFHTEINFSDAEYKSGLIIRKKTMMMSPDVLTVVKRKLAISIHHFTQEWVYLHNNRTHDSEGYNSLKHKFVTMCVPLEVVLLDNVVGGVSRNPQYTDSYQGVFVHESDVLGMLPQLLLLTLLHKKLIVVCQTQEIKMDAPDYKVFHGLSVAMCISVKTSVVEMFTMVQEMTNNLSPRNYPPKHEMLNTPSSRAYDFRKRLAKEGINDRGRESSAFTTISKHPGYAKAYNSLNRLHYVKKIERWMVLIKQLRPAVSLEIVLKDILDVRLKTLTEMSLNPSKDHFRMPKMSAMNIRSGSVLSEFSFVRRKVRFITTLYLPVVSRLKECLQVMDFKTMQMLASRYMFKSSNLGLFHLSCCFLTLQEVLSVMVTLPDYAAMHNKERITGTARTESSGKTNKRECETDSNPRVPAFRGLGIADGGNNIPHYYGDEEDPLLCDSKNPFFNDKNPDFEPMTMVHTMLKVSEAKSKSERDTNFHTSLQGFVLIVGENVINTVDEMINTIEMAAWDSAYEIN